MIQRYVNPQPAALKYFYFKLKFALESGVCEEMQIIKNCSKTGRYRQSCMTGLN